MSDENKTPEEQKETEPIVYASPVKRIWAWVGTVYMLIIVLLFTYMLAFGAYLKGIGGIMVCPALGGIIVSTVFLWRQRNERSTAQALLFGAIVALCAVLIALGLWNGIPALIANFGVR